MHLVWFIVLIGVLITVHEVGHFALAKLCDVKVLRLSLGFGPRLATIKRGETEYILSAIPLGGYVKLLGEDPGDVIDEKERHRAFPHKPLWQRGLVVLAGPIANLVFPAFIYFHFYAGEETALSSTVGTVLEGQPAADVLRPGDRIVAIDDVPVRYWDDVNRIFTASPGKDLRVTFERPGDDKPETRVLTPRAHERRDLLGATATVGMIGVAPHYQLAQIGVAPTDANDASQPSPAARADLRTFDVVTSVQGRPVETWHDLDRILESNRGEMLVVTYLRPQASVGWAALARMEPGTAQVFPSRVLAPSHKGPRYDSGIRSGEMFLHDVEPGTPAAQAGLAPGDCITTVDGAPIAHWELLTQAFEERRERSFQLGWRTTRGDERVAILRLQPRTLRDEYQTESTTFVFGGEPSRATRRVAEVPIEGRLGWAAHRAAATTAHSTWTLLRVYRLFLLGELNASAVGGPIMIYHLAGIAAARGPSEFLLILAIISLNVGLLNLLPVPLLDGGHLIYFLVEAVRKRPVARAVRERANYVGLFILGALTLLALRNDILRYWLS